MTEAPFIAVVEDDPEIRALAVSLLERENFDAAACENAAALDDLLTRRTPDLIILDVMMPGEDGLSVCRRISAQGGPPIMLVTAKGDDIDRIIGLEIGADDYLPKPFHPRELVARARAILRRASSTTASALPSSGGHLFRFEGWSLDPAARGLLDPDGLPVELSAGEFELLSAFVQHPQRVLSRDFLMDWTKGRDATPFDRAVDVALSRLRRKLRDDPQSPKFIRTVRNGGYLFAPRVERA
ncbi:MAG: response regulator [Alphaproteobacteria bacterium]|nr:response regulator [Alphaproteobacteria bacterium]